MTQYFLSQHPLFVYFYFFYFLDIPNNFISRDFFVCTPFYRFYFSFVCIYVIVQTVHEYMYEQNKKWLIIHRDGTELQKT